MHRAGYHLKNYNTSTLKVIPILTEFAVTVAQALSDVVMSSWTYVPVMIVLTPSHILLPYCIPVCLL